MFNYKGLLYDLYNGTIRKQWAWIVPIASAVLLCSDLLVQSIVSARTGTVLSPTTGDYIFSVLGGIPSYVVKAKEYNDFPIAWVIMCILSAAVCLNYPTDELYGFGIHTLTRLGSRSVWWTQKCLWIIFHTVHFYVLFYLSIFLFSIIFGSELKLQLSIEYVLSLSYDVPLDILQEKVFYAFLLPVCVSITINLVQLYFALLDWRIVGFFLSLAYYIASTLFPKCYLLGNYSMLIRWAYEAPDKLLLQHGIIIFALCIVLTLLGGMLVFRRKSILQKEV